MTKAVISFGYPNLSRLIFDLDLLLLFQNKALALVF